MVKRFGINKALDARSVDTNGNDKHHCRDKMAYCSAVASVIAST
jgi:hypothetical protein